MKWLFILLLFILPTSEASGASGAPQLIGALPKPNEHTHHIDDNRIILEFSEPIDMGRSKVVVTDGEGFVLSQGIEARGDVIDVKMKARVVQGYLPGNYTVKWTVITPGGSPAEGEFSFHMHPH